MRPALLLLVAGAAIAAASCRRPAPPRDGMLVTMSVAPRPPVVGIARLELLLSDESGHPLEAGAVEVTGNMTHPGMVPTHATARLDGPGRWLADLELTMGGDWIVEVEARLPDGRLLRRDLPLPGVSAR